MPELTIQIQELDEVPQGAVALLNGAIDAKTVVGFQNQLNAVKDRGVRRFILDMEHVRYVNSTGLGYLINLADSVQPQGGGVALVKVQPKVKIVFDMLGLNAFFNIFGAREDAIGHFAAAEAAPAEPPAETEAEAAPAPEEPEVRSEDAGEPAPAPVEAESPAVPESAAPPPEPGAIVCAGCGAALSASGSGHFKCPRCSALFSVDGAGRATFRPRRDVAQVEMNLTDTPEGREGLVHCVALFARRAGFSPDLVACLREAVGDAVAELVEHSFSRGQAAGYNALVVTHDSELEIRLADHGRTLRGKPVNARGQELFSLARQVMDTFDLKPHPRGGNVIIMIKKVSRKP